MKGVVDFDENKMQSKNWLFFLSVFYICMFFYIFICLHHFCSSCFCCSHPFLHSSLFVSLRSGLHLSMASLVRFCLSAGASVCTTWWVLMWFTLPSPLERKSPLYFFFTLVTLWYRTYMLWCPIWDPFIAWPCHRRSEKFLIYLWPVVKSIFPLWFKLCTECERTTAFHSPSVVSKGSYLWMIKRTGWMEQQLSWLVVQGVPQGSVMGPFLMNSYFMSVMSIQ